MSIALVFANGGIDGFAQQPQEIEVGKKYSYASKFLNEKREYWVSLPPEYNSEVYQLASYPVIYLLDSESQFHIATAICNLLSSGAYAMMPRSIVVGIVNTNRTRDLTPEVKANVSTDETTARFNGAGGNRNFLDFLEKELFSEIDSRYRTNGYRVFIGHSLGGLTVLNAFLNRTAMFNAYLAVDPSLWWDNSVLNRQAESELKSRDFGGRQVFVASANKKIIPQDTTTDMIRTIGRFGRNLKESNAEGLIWNWKFYESEDHSTIPVPAIQDGLRFFFKDFQVEVKAAFEKPDLVKQQYEKLSEQLRFKFVPAESWLDLLGDVAEKRGRKEASLRFYEINTDLYPQSRHTWERFADALLKSGDTKKAKLSRDKAAALSK